MQSRSTHSGEHRHHFDHDGRQIFVPGFGYGYGYGSPFWYDSGYPDDGTDMSSGSSDGTTDSGVAGNTPAAPIPNGAAPLGQQPAAWPVRPEASPAWARANAELTQAQAEMDAARERVRQSLIGRPDYKAAVAQKSVAEDRVETLHASGVSNFETLLPAAQAALEARQRVTGIETVAMNNDPQVIEARTRLQAATANHNALQAQAG